MADDDLTVIVSSNLPEAIGEGERPTRYLGEEGLFRRRIKPETLKSELGKLVKTLNEVVGSLANDAKNLRLAEMTVAVEISASGQVGIIGTGVAGEATGGITLTFVVGDRKA